MRRRIDLILLVIVVVAALGLAYTHQDAFGRIARNVQTYIAPCKEPLTYSIVRVDPRFGIATSTLIKNLEQAENIWESPSGRDLFTYVAEGGDVAVSLVYDERQAATDSLKRAGIGIKKSRESYESLKVMYDTVSERIQSTQAAYRAEAAAYERRLDAYNAQVQMWNQRGGAPPNEYEKLQAEKAALAEQLSGIKASEARINSDVERANALATTLNQLIVQLNINVEQYNRAGAATGGFEEGLYQSSAGGQTISIYEYEDRTQLVRVLAHEMGHALGLDHVEDEEAIMYKINKADTLTATPADLAELEQVCSSGFSS